MTVCHFSLFVGFAFLAVGVLGLLPGPHIHPPIGAPPLAVETQYGYLFGLFPLNVLHNVVHLVIGALGVVASQRVAASITFSRGLAVFYGLLAVMGLVPGLHTTFGLIPVFGHDVWLHGVTAAAAAWFGWGWAAHRTPRPVRGTPRHA